MQTKIEIERGNEIEKGDENMGKEAEKERGDEIKKFQKTILQTQSLGRIVNREGTEWGLGREKNLPPSERQAMYP